MEEYELLERELGEWCGRPHGVVCSSGSAALHLALESLGLPHDSMVLVPEFTMIACARGVTMANLKPRFIDCDDRMLVDVDDIDSYLDLCWEDAVNVSAIMPVHIYGRRCDMDRIQRLARRYNAAVIEDMAEAHGMEIHPDTDAACYSFYRNKIVCGEEGGAIAFKHQEDAERAKTLRNIGFTDRHDFLHVPRGWNYRLSNANAGSIRESLKNFKRNLNARRWVVGWYEEFTPSEWKLPERDIPWVYDVMVPEGVDMESIVRSLNEEGISARMAFKPMSEQLEYRSDDYKASNTYRLSRRVMYLPIDPDMTRDDCRRILERMLEHAGPESQPPGLRQPRSRSGIRSPG